MDSWICWPWTMLTSFMTACLDDKFYDRVLWYWVYGHELCCRVYDPCLDVESAGHVLWCRVGWPRAKRCCDIVYIGNVLEKKNLSYKMLFDLNTTFSSSKMNNITIIELKFIGKQRGIEGYYKLRKAELIHKLEALTEVNEQVLIPGLEIPRNATRSVNTIAILDGPILDDNTLLL